MSNSSPMPSPRSPASEPSSPRSPSSGRMSPLRLPSPASPPSPFRVRFLELLCGDPAELAAFLGAHPAEDPGLELACSPLQRAVTEGRDGLPPAPPHRRGDRAFDAFLRLYAATSEFLAVRPAGFAAEFGVPDLDARGEVFCARAGPSATAFSRRQQALILLEHQARRLLAAAYGPPTVACLPRGSRPLYHPLYSAVYAGGLPAVEAVAAWCRPSAEAFAAALVVAFGRPGGAPDSPAIFAWLASRAGPLPPRALNAAFFSAWRAEGVPVVLAHPGFWAREALADPALRADPGLAGRLAELAAAQGAP